MSAPNRNSRIDRASKRISAYAFPQSYVDFRGSWPVMPAGQTVTGGRPMSTYQPPPNLADNKNALERIESVDSVAEYKQGRSEFIEDEETDQVLGSTELYDKDGNLRLVPTPTPNPKDPLNLPEWRKWAAVGALCLFGSVALAAEIAVAGLTPVFLLEYSGVNAAEVLKTADLKNNPDPLALIPKDAPNQVSLSQIALLATIPMLSNGVATYLLVPLSMAIGRRPVMLLTATLAWLSGFWAGASQSLNEHVAARVFHGLGSGTVEALIPLIIQDFTFLHQRPKAIAAVFAAQGPMIVLFGILGPWIAVNYTWRYVYFITSAIGILAWLGLIAYVPETRVSRSKAELAGQQIYPMVAGEDRTRLDYTTYGKRTMWDDLGMFNYGFEWRESVNNIVATLRTIVFPAVMWATLVQTVFGLFMSASGQVISFALLAAGVPFELTGLSNLPNLLATVFIFLVGGVAAEKLTLWISKKKGSREPEYALPNLILPIIFAIAGAMIFGVADQFGLHYMVLLTGMFLLMTAPLMTAPIIQNFVMESYPQWAGPVLTNVSTLRVFTGFFLNTQATTWFTQLGPIAFMAYSSLALVIVVGGGIPILFKYGKKLRSLTSGKVAKRPQQKWVGDQP